MQTAEEFVDENIARLTGARINPAHRLKLVFSICSISPSPFRFLF